MERVREGDALALEMIFVAFRSELLVLADRVTGSRAIGEEVLQDVFLAIWRGRRGWHVATSLRAYLRRAVERTGSRARTSRTRGATSGASLDAGDGWAMAQAIPDGAPTPADNAAYEDLRHALEAATTAMPARVRDVFLLRRREELSNAEIATRLGVSVKTVETHMARALRFLRQRLAPWRDRGGPPPG
ncbi:MAG: sigma-70 family RNA polymerase sigma factor [Gemmatimonadota bacterium]|nr:sigma-70 family RNA polymerase sigma factor [Gemmatimonadota bacterium]